MGTDRDRTYVINSAIDAYLEVYQWQLDHIKEGLRQADAGEFASDDEFWETYFDAVERFSRDFS